MVSLSRERGSVRCRCWLVVGQHDNHAAGALSTLHQHFLPPGAAHILVFWSSSALAMFEVVYFLIVGVYLKQCLK